MGSSIGGTTTGGSGGSTTGGMYGITGGGSLGGFIITGGGLLAVVGSVAAQPTNRDRAKQNVTLCITNFSFER